MSPKGKLCGQLRFSDERNRTRDSIQPNKVITNENGTIYISAHEDKKINFYDPLSGKIVCVKHWLKLLNRENFQERCRPY